MGGAPRGAYSLLGPGRTCPAESSGQWLVVSKNVEGLNWSSTT